MSIPEFNDLVVDNSAFLKPVAFTLTRDNEDAGELIQETLYRALANREKYHAGSNVKAWMYTIMRNIFINNYRSKRRRSILLADTNDEFFINHIPSAVSNSAEGNLGLKELHLLLYKLPAVLKHPFQLYFEGYKYTEIALMLGEPLGTVKSRIHFARKLLKEQSKRS